MKKTLIIGASGSVGSQVVKELDANHEGITVRLASSRVETAEKWRQDGREAVVLDLNDPDTFPAALEGVDRVFLLTGYTADMLYQSKMLIDAAADAGVSHLVHLGVMTSGRDRIPHYAWHDLIEAYLAASGMAWTNLHPNVITDSVLMRTPPITETGSITVTWGEAALGWVSASDIAAVAAAVLREGPETHAGADYWLSPEVVTGPQVAALLSDELGAQITCDVQSSQALAAIASTVQDAGTRLYMDSATHAMAEAESGHQKLQETVRDDVQTVLGRPATPLRDWARENLTATS